MKLVPILVTLMLTSCATTKQESMFIDSRMPSLPGIHVCEPNAEGKPGKVMPTAPCLVQVRAGDWLSRVPVAVEKGELYRLTIPQDQFWYDDTRLSKPLSGDEGTWFMNLFGAWKRHPRSKWFALMAVVLPDADSDKEVLGQDLVRSAILVVPQSGQLALYPNDASIGVFGRCFFYANNHGLIWALVERCNESCAVLPHRTL
jgi:hypothetical protein